METARARIAALGCAVAAALAPASASASTTVGSPIYPMPSYPGTCTAGHTTCANVPLGIPGGQATVPSDGVITSWRVNAMFSANRSATLRVLRSNGGDFTAVAHSTTEPLSSGVPYSHATRIPVKAGDLIGMSGTFAALTVFRDSSGSVTFANFSPPLTDGTTGSATQTAVPVEMAMNATVEPDVDGDGYGDETQDPCPQISNYADPCVADLRVTNTATTSGIGQLMDTTFFVAVRNTGPYSAPGSTVTDSIPSGLRVDRVKSDAGSCEASGSVRCEFGTIAPNTTVTVRVDVTGTAKGRMRTVATAATQGLDSDSTNDSAAAEVSVLNPGACSTTVRLGPGDDVFTATAAGEEVLGGAGDDVIEGGAGNDCIEGQAGDDTLRGQAGGDYLKGGPGDDLLEGGEQRDIYIAGSGNDIVNSRDGVGEEVNCGKGRDRAIVDRKDHVKRCEKVKGQRLKRKKKHRCQGAKGKKKAEKAKRKRNKKRKCRRKRKRRG